MFVSDRCTLENGNHDDGITTIRLRNLEYTSIRIYVYDGPMRASIFATLLFYNTRSNVTSYSRLIR